MNKFKSFKNNIFKINAKNFEKNALDLFKFQAKHNIIYNQYLLNLRINAEEINSLENIPFLPIEFFKTQRVKTGDWEPEVIFESSGTTGQIRSRHYIEDLEFYRRISKWYFEENYGKLHDHTIMALLPSYLERGNSSLVAMVAEFLNDSQLEFSGFYLNNLKELSDNLVKLNNNSRPVILIGVSFALLNLADNFQYKLSNTIIMETGGMKGRREELTRDALHRRLKSAFDLEQIHSEYGMTELLSQAYANDKGLFKSPSWMRVMIREINDPFNLIDQDRIGGINVIDLANIHSCAFIETQDMGRKCLGDRFEILGRFDNSDVRGCNLLSL